MEFKPVVYIDNKDPDAFREYVFKYMPEFRKDKHKVNYKFEPKKDSIGLPYIVMMSDDGEPAGYMCYDIHKISSKIAATTHCLSVRPAYRGNKLSEVMIKTLEEAIVDKFGVDYIYEICNEISTKSYVACGFKETGSYRKTKDGERCLIRLIKELK